ncbi:C40 family peptidase [Streptomyces sp. NPDC006704]|uniref:C40 family peptidase n=1 Tax=Streptomyces sp. NPDC006704 TaxID=3364760 RepID=UPI0036B12B20
MPSHRKARTRRRERPRHGDGGAALLTAHAPVLGVTTAALASLSLLAQSAGLGSAGQGPSADEVRRKVVDLYRQADPATATAVTGSVATAAATVATSVGADDATAAAHRRAEANRAAAALSATRQSLRAAKREAQHKLTAARALLAVPPPAPISAPTHGLKAAGALAFARAQVGKPYVRGAAGPASYDCAGLTRAAWMAAGVELPRAARDQTTAGAEVAPGELRPGDLLFFYDDRSHVGLYSGRGMMIHAPHSGAYVREEPVGCLPVRGAVRPG